MTLALFGFNDGALNLVVNLLVLFLVVVWLALVYWTYMDAKRRMEDPVLIMSAAAASLFPFVGTLVYTILRPPEFLADAHERELEIRAAELRVRQLAEASCPNCEHPVERSYLRCPNCQVRLKDPCPSCSKPIDPRWSLCPYCETAVRARSESQPGQRQRRPTRPGGPSGRPPSRSAPPRSSSTGSSASRGPASRKPGQPSQRSPQQRPVSSGPKPSGSESPTRSSSAPKRSSGGDNGSPDGSKGGSPSGSPGGSKGGSSGRSGSSSRSS